MRKSIENQIRKAHLDRDNNDSRLSFDKEKVWQTIHSEKNGRIVFWQSVSVAAAVFFMLLSGGLSYMLFSSNEKVQSYEMQLSCLEREQKSVVEYGLSNQSDTVFVVRTKEVLKIPPEVAVETQRLQKELKKMQKDRRELVKRLDISVGELALLRNTLKVLKGEQIRPLFAEKKDLKANVNSSKQLAVNINKEAFRNLPLDETHVVENDMMKIRIINKNKEKIQTVSAPFFTSIFQSNK